MKNISAIVEKHSDILLPLLSLAHISHKTYERSYEFLLLYQAILPEEVGSNGIKFMSPKYYFPVDSGRGFYELIVAFVLLYAVAESFICIGEGRDPKLRKMLKQFREWYIEIDNTEENIEEREDDLELLEMPKLDSYSFVRAGKWWAVLGRDRWKCLSCGRSTREGGVLLEVDHIIPRSRGGSDDMINLQTLCRKCNIGKSNKDSTRL